jgi:opacity protein-like surface antigen
VAGTLSAVMTGGAAQAANPVPLPPQLVNHPFDVQKSATDLYSWGPGSNEPGNCAPNPGEIQGDANNITLSTTGAYGNCTEVESQHTYPTTDGYVYETDMYFSSNKNWPAFWMYGDNWPSGGEIDALEINFETNYVSYHYGSSAPGSELSTYNGSLKTLSANITPGWHIIDISFGGGDISVWYDGKQYVNVPMNIAAPAWIVWSEGSCDQPGGSVCASSKDVGAPGYVEVKWLRIFT